MTPEQLHELSIRMHAYWRTQPDTPRCLQARRVIEDYVDSLLAAERAAVVAECAKVCDDAVCVYNSNEQDMLAKQCAFLIRKLGEKRGPD